MTVKIGTIATIATVIAGIALMFVFGLHGLDRVDQVKRSNTQDRYLAQMEAVKSADVSRLAADWRAHHPKPTNEQLTDLRILSQRLIDEPALAARYKSVDHFLALQREEANKIEDASLKSEGPVLKIKSRTDGI